MKVVIAPDSFGGTLSASEAAEAIAEGWRRERPHDELILRALSDGGEGLLDVVAGDGDRRVTVEVADPLGHPRTAVFLVRQDDTAIVESAEACGLRHVPEGRRNPLQTTSYGVGQLLDAARAEGVERILVGMGGSATVDGGAGALSGLGFRLMVEDGSGLKVGGADLQRVAKAGRDWVDEGWDDVEVLVLCDVTTRLLDAPAVFGPQKGADAQAVGHLEEALRIWADVAERDLSRRDPREKPLRDEPGSGAAGGLSFGLAAGLGAGFRQGSEAVADLVGLGEALKDADIVVVGEGRLDQTSFEGKVAGEVRRRAREVGVRVAGVVGAAGSAAEELDDLEQAAPDGPGEDPRAEVAAAAARLAGRA